VPLVAHVVASSPLGYGGIVVTVVVPNNSSNKAREGLGFGKEPPR
jgi:hypothetical protein